MKYFCRQCTFLLYSIMKPIFMKIFIVSAIFWPITGCLGDFNFIYSGCDEIVFDPMTIFLDNNISYNYGSDNAKLLINSNIYNRNMFSSVKSTCQTIIGKNITIPDVHYHSSRIPSKVVILSDKDVIYHKRLPYDLHQMTMDNGKITIRNYSAYADNRWRHLKVAYTKYAPFIFKDFKGELKGITFDIWKILEAKLGLKLNFTYKHSTYAENYEKLVPGLVDLALPQDSLWISKYQIADPTHFLFFERLMFFNIKPGPVTTLLTLVYPFETHVWITLGFALAFACMAIYLINLKGSLSYFHTFQVLMSPILSDPLPNTVNKTHMNWYGCMVLTIWPLTGLLLSAAYSSNLLANLTVVEKMDADNTFEDLINNKRTLGLPKGTILEHWMKNSPRQVVRKAEKECVSERNGYYDGLSSQETEHPQMRVKLEQGEASNIVMVSLFPKLQHKYRLGTDVLMDTFSTYYMTKRHPIKSYIDVQMERLTNAGITLHIRDQYVWSIARSGRDYERYQAATETDANKITLQHLYPLWIILGFGLSIGFLSFIGETFLIGIIFRHNQKRHNLIHLIDDSDNLVFI